MNRIELAYYIMAGFLATAVDWATFSFSTNWLNISYPFALVLALSMGASTHYFTNKKMTFKCNSRKYASQISLYVFLASFTLLSSLGIIALLIKFASLNAVWARMLTTGIMILPNYLLHKHLTFNKKIFLQA